MKIKIICVGKIKEKFFKDAISEYSEKNYTNTEGKLTNTFQYQVENILANKEDPGAVIGAVFAHLPFIRRYIPFILAKLALNMPSFVGFGQAHEEPNLLFITPRYLVK